MYRIYLKHLKLRLCLPCIIVARRQQLHILPWQTQELPHEMKSITTEKRFFFPFAVPDPQPGRAEGALIEDFLGGSIQGGFGVLKRGGFEDGSGGGGIEGLV